MTDNHLEIYVCPCCHGSLGRRPEALACPACAREFPYRLDIPDFLLEPPSESADPFLRDVESFGRLAAIYETPLWLPLVGRLAGGWQMTPAGELFAFARGLMSRVQGRVLDVATGTATFGRHVAGVGRTVYGVDVSLHMMRKGQAYVRQERVEGMHFARAHAQALPFADAEFNGCLIGGSLHIFPDTARALAEITRTLTPGAPVWITTMFWGDRGLLSFGWMRRRMERNRKMRVFELPALRQFLLDAGLERIEMATQGSFVMVTASKA